MKNFLSDLDNTLIYSHHRNICVPKVAVERMDGREQSFMTEFTYDYLSKAAWLNLIPVTTRTEKQYRRISCFQELKVKYAVICNGGKLLINDVEDEEWSKETIRISTKHLDVLREASNNLKKICANQVLHHPEAYMYYVKCDAPEKVYEKLSDSIDRNSVDIEHDNRKVYLFARGINKGAAVERLKKKLCMDEVVAAGDDFMDIPMLNAADIIFSGEKIFEFINSPDKTNVGTGLISDKICDCLEELHKKSKG